MGVIQQGAGGWQTRVFQHRIPAGFLVLEPAPDAFPVDRSSRARDVASKVAEPLAQRKHAPTLALACGVEQRMELGASRLADRQRDRRQWLRELVDGVAETVAEARSWKERAQTLGGAVEAIGEDPPDAIRRLLLGRGTLERPIGLGQGCGTGVLGVPQVPDDAATDDRGEIHLLCEAVAVFFIREDIRGQRQPTPRQHLDQALLTERTDQTVERHRREMLDDRAELQTETTMGGQERITGHLRSQRAVTPDARRQDGEHGFARGALDTPDGETTADTGIVGVARQTPTRAAAGFVGELKAESEEKREHEFNKRFGGAQERKVGRLITEVAGDRAVVAYRFGGVFHVSSPGQMSLARMRQDEGKILKEQAYSGMIETSSLNPGECGISCCRGRRKRCWNSCTP